jgi:hypothetical protein
VEVEILAFLSGQMKDVSDKIHAVEHLNLTQLCRDICWISDRVSQRNRLEAVDKVKVSELVRTEVSVRFSSCS